MSVRLVLPIPVAFAPGPGREPAAPAPAADRMPLAGARVVIVNNRWRSMTVLARLLRDRLLALGAAAVEERAGHITHPLPPADVDAIAGRFDAAIVGLGN